MDYTVHGIFQARILKWVNRSLLPGIFPTQGSNPCLLHCRWVLLSAVPPGKPKNTAVGSLSLLQGIFPTQELNRGLLHCSQILYQPSYQGSPTNKLTSLKKKKKKLSFYPWTLSSHCSNHTYKPLTIHTHTHQIHSPSTHLLHPLNTYFYSVSAILLRLLSKSRKSSL